MFLTTLFPSISGMARVPRGPPPFSSGTAKAAAAQKSKSINAPSRDDPQGDKGKKRLGGEPVQETVPAAQAREDTERVTKRHRSGKEPSVCDAGLPPPPPNFVANGFAKLGLAAVSDAEMNSWATYSLEKTNAAITKAAAEIFFRQTTRHKEMRSLIATQKEIVREVKLYKTKAESLADEMKSMTNAHTLEAAKAASTVSDLEKRLRDAEKEREIDLDKHVEFVKTLQTRITELEGQLKKAAVR